MEFTFRSYSKCGQTINRLQPYFSCHICHDAASHIECTVFNQMEYLEGVEIMYYLYSPLVLSIETLRLEKRLDDHLHYYRDCLPEYSTFPMDMEAEPLPDGIPAPVNDIKVEFKPLPWHRKWWRHDLKGVNYPKLSIWHVVDKKKNSEPIWEKLDLMKEYRSTITEEEQARIYRDLIPHLSKFEEARRKVKKIRAFKSDDIKTNN